VLFKRLSCLLLSFTQLSCLLHSCLVFCTAVLSFAQPSCLLHSRLVFYTAVLSFTQLSCLLHSCLVFCTAVLSFAQPSCYSQQILRDMLVTVAATLCCIIRGTQPFHSQQHHPVAFPSENYTQINSFQSFQPLTRPDFTE